ncbi:hypothetical protein IFM89_034508 [Coptis chinensis]|uniref:Uncharacterized protein n=1 Tax=Coptis chinensis TaxID=261450 RepID=A0A835LQ06_9MAGN|nr:hypothetical protein IFM89_034508 [Coptis chinensis]
MITMLLLHLRLVSFFLFRCLFGAHEGQGLHIRAVDGIFHVLRAFEDLDIIHVDDSMDPVRDLDVITKELRLKDIEFMERKVEDLEKNMKRSNDKQLKLEHECCEKDMHNENLEETIPYPCKVSESIYSVQQIANEYNMEQTNAYSVEDDSSVQERNCLSPIRYPLLEVNETGLECFKENSPIKHLDPEPACINLMLEVDFNLLAHMQQKNPKPVAECLAKGATRVQIHCLYRCSLDDTRYVPTTTAIISLNRCPLARTSKISKRYRFELSSHRTLTQANVNVASTYGNEASASISPASQLAPSEFTKAGHGDAYGQADPAPSSRGLLLATLPLLVRNSSPLRGSLFSSRHGNAPFAL